MPNPGHLEIPAVNVLWITSWVFSLYGLKKKDKLDEKEDRKAGFMEKFFLKKYQPV
jgi:hypothetical protein